MPDVREIVNERQIEGFDYYDQRNTVIRPAMRNLSDIFVVNVTELGSDIKIGTTSPPRTRGRIPYQVEYKDAEGILRYKKFMVLCVTPDRLCDMGEPLGFYLTLPKGDAEDPKKLLKYPKASDEEIYSYFTRVSAKEKVTEAIGLIEQAYKHVRNSVTDRSKV